MCFMFVFGGRVSLCSPGSLGTCSVDKAGCELRDSIASASKVLGLWPGISIIVLMKGFD